MSKEDREGEEDIEKQVEKESLNFGLRMEDALC